MKKILSLVAICLFSINFFAQKNDNPAKRLGVIFSDVDLKDRNIPGSPCFSTSKTKRRRSRQVDWTFSFFNLDTYVPTGRLSLHKKNRLKGVATTTEGAYAVFLDRRKTLKIFRFGLDASTPEPLVFDFSDYRRISDVCMLDNQLLLAMDRHKKVLSVDWEAKTLSRIPLDLDKSWLSRIRVNNFQYTSDEDEAYLFLNLNRSRRRKDVNVVKFDKNAQAVKTFNLSQNNDIQFRDVSIVETEDGRHIFSGSYNSGKARRLNIGEHAVNLLGILSGSGIPFLYDPTVSQGVFLAEYGDEKLNFIQFHNHTDLQSYRLQLEDFRLKKLKKKDEKSKNPSREFVDEKNIIFHPAMALDDGFLLIGEVYESTTRPVSYGTDNNQYVFDGYLYTTMHIIFLDKAGNLVWDAELSNHYNGKPMQLIKTAALEKTGNNTVKIHFSVPYYGRHSTDYNVYGYSYDFSNNNPYKYSGSKSGDYLYVDSEGNIGRNPGVTDDSRRISSLKERAIVPEGRFFQEKGLSIGASLPLFTSFGNSTLRPLDTYHLGYDFDLFFDSKPIFKNTKFRLNTGMFMYMDTYSLLLTAAASNDDPYYYDDYYYYGYFVGAMGLRVGGSLVFDERWIVGADFPIGFGNSRDILFSGIYGVTPRVGYVFRGIKSDIYAECRFPIWNQPADKSPVGLTCVVGWTSKTYRKPKRK